MSTYTIRIPADPSKEVLFEAHDDHLDLSLSDLQEGIGGGYIERRQPWKDVSVWVDEEGLLKGLPRNARAEYLCNYQPLVGDAFVTGANDPGTPGLTFDAAARVANALLLNIPEELT